MPELNATQKSLLEDREIVEQIQAGKLTFENAEKLHKAFQGVGATSAFIEKIDSLHLSDAALHQLVHAMLLQERNELKGMMLRQKMCLGKALIIHEAKQAGFGDAFRGLDLSSAEQINHAIQNTKIPEALVDHYRKIVVPELQKDSNFRNQMGDAIASHIRFNILSTIVNEHVGPVLKNKNSHLSVSEMAQVLKEALLRFNAVFSYDSDKGKGAPLPSGIEFNKNTVEKVFNNSSDEIEKYNESVKHLVQQVEQRLGEGFRLSETAKKLDDLKKQAAGIETQIQNEPKGLIARLSGAYAKNIQTYQTQLQQIQSEMMQCQRQLTGNEKTLEAHTQFIKANGGEEFLKGMLEIYKKAGIANSLTQAMSGLSKAEATHVHKNPAFKITTTVHENPLYKAKVEAKETAQAPAPSEERPSFRPR